MKILTIRVCNLASLVGEALLRLDQQPLGPTGLFAISGPTGSGKSTLLDAMCLALFARTPRLQSRSNSLVGRADEDPKDRLRSQDPRGLLSRGCGSGFAEVDFRGQDGRSYRARWSVRRSRDKPEGRIQKDQITLTDIESGQRLGEHKKDSLELIEQKLGLEYDQFRRSVLLAQGDFAAFLEADPSERGELLESITGMEIYSRLSRAAHERAKVEKEQLDLILARSEGLVTLEENKRKELEKQETDLVKQQDRLQKDKSALDKAVEWYQHQRELGESELQARETLLVSLRGLREKAGLAVAGWSALEGEICQAEAMALLWRHLKQELSTEVEKLAKSEAELGEWVRAAAKAQKDVEVAQKEAASSEKELEDALALRDDLAKQGLENDAWFSAHVDWRELCTQWPRWKQELDRARQVAFEVSESQREKEATEKSVVAYKGDLEEARAQHEAAGKQLELAEQALGVTARQLAGLDLEKLLAESARLRRCRESVVELLDLGVRRQALEVTRLKALGVAKEQGRALEQTWVAIADASRKKLELESAHKESLRQLTALIEKQSLEDHRKRLNAGEPCPLCGALEHPYAEDVVSDLLDEAQARAKALHDLVDEVEGKLLTLSSQVGSQETAQAQAQTKALDAEAQRVAIEAEARDVISSIQADWREDIQPALVDSDSERDRLRVLKERLESLERAQSARIEERGNLEKALREATELGEQARALSLKTLEVQRELESALQKADLGIQFALKNANRAKTELEKLLDALASVLEPKSDWRERFYETPDLLFEELDQLCLEWTERSSVKSLIEKQVVELGSRLHGLRSLSQERRKRVDAMSKDSRSRQLVIAKRVAQHREWLGGEGSQVLRQLLVDADKHAVLLKERSRALQQHGEKKPTQGEEACRQAFEERISTLDGLVAELESLRFHLRTDKDARVKLEALLPDIQAQQERSEIWRELADLIGSYDGRKFRDFAQSLSLDAMIAQANHHLTELAPRYRLQRVPGQDLDLQIRDLHMGDEVRSVHSLSGGESFLVSLALALGLSSMHASQCSLESLFIDEGFGSLDEESLEIAVAALDALQATGRQIGLISHVAGLADRIGREVHVRPLGGGRSKLVY